MHEFRVFNFSLVLFELTKVALVIVVFLAIFVVFIGAPLLVKGESMEPNFHSGELVIVEKVSFSFSKPIKRGDVVAAKFPADLSHTRLIKRVIGLPGEKVKAVNGSIYINDQLLNEEYQTKVGEIPYPEIDEVTLLDNQYFLAGDNRPGSSDSRLWGPVLRDDILGRVSFVIFPPKYVQYVDRPN